MDAERVKSAMERFRQTTSFPFPLVDNVQAKDWPTPAGLGQVLGYIGAEIGTVKRFESLLFTLSGTFPLLQVQVTVNVTGVKPYVLEIGSEVLERTAKTPRPRTLEVDTDNAEEILQT